MPWQPQQEWFHNNDCLRTSYGHALLKGESKTFAKHCGISKFPTKRKKSPQKSGQHCYILLVKAVQFYHYALCRKWKWQLSPKSASSDVERVWY